MNDWYEFAKVVGGGGILALLVLREVLPHVRDRKNGRQGGRAAEADGKRVELSADGMHQIMSNVVASTVVPVLSNQTSILSAQTVLLDKLRDGQEELARLISVVIDRIPRA